VNGTNSDDTNAIWGYAYGTEEYQQTRVFTSNEGFQPENNPLAFSVKPSQSVYNIEFAIACMYAGHGAVYVKDINVLLEVIDGLPPS
jgi:hypothetical protein